MNVVKVTVAVATCAVLTEVVYQVYLKFRKRKPKKRNGNTFKVIFFPDQKIACKSYFLQRGGCQNLNCKFSHATTSLSQLYENLTAARKSIDLCVFTISCQDLVDAIVDLHKNGVSVRVITDDEQVDATGSQIWRLRKEGVCVRTDNSSFFMHHKFVVVDKKLLINGSFNWTRQAITGNQENLLITNNKDLVQAYLQEFERLWTNFDPKMLYK